MVPRTPAALRRIPRILLRGSATRRLVTVRCKGFPAAAAACSLIPGRGVPCGPREARSATRSGQGGSDSASVLLIRARVGLGLRREAHDVDGVSVPCSRSCCGRRTFARGRCVCRHFLTARVLAFVHDCRVAAAQCALHTPRCSSWPLLPRVMLSPSAEPASPRPPPRLRAPPVRQCAPPAFRAGFRSASLPLSVARHLHCACRPPCSRPTSPCLRCPRR